MAGYPPGTKLRCTGCGREDYAARILRHQGNTKNCENAEVEVVRGPMQRGRPLGVPSTLPEQITGESSGGAAPDPPPEPPDDPPATAPPPRQQGPRPASEAPPRVPLSRSSAKGRDDDDEPSGAMGVQGKLHTESWPVAEDARVRITCYVLPETFALINAIMKAGEDLPILDEVSYGGVFDAVMVGFMAQAGGVDAEGNVYGYEVGLIRQLTARRPLVVAPAGARLPI
jgi:hypothetical protein